ncbi:MAG: hypothetical protein U0990_09520 [Candidatus Nanopelagicales bacterium]|nr:hypothetical protein [Candidatus Nanopelagicales bacterium]
MQGFAIAENGHRVISHWPQTILPNTTVAGDVFSMKEYERAEILISSGDGDPTTGDGLLTVEACDNVTPDNVTAIPFRLYKGTVSSDLRAAGIAVAATGYTFLETDNGHWTIEVLARDLPDGKPYLRAVIHSCSGGTVGTPFQCEVLLTGARHGGAVPATAIT